MPLPLPYQLPPETPDKEIVRVNAYHARSQKLNPYRFDALHSSFLKAWMIEYAQWLANEPGMPTAKERRAKLNYLTRGRVKSDDVHRLLVKRDDFCAYLAEITKGPVEAARARFKSHIPEYIEGYKEGFEQARAAGDYKSVKDFVIPVLDRVMPKHGDAAQTAQNITIVLTAGQHAALQAPLPVLEAEVVPDPSVPPAPPEEP